MPDCCTYVAFLRAINVGGTGRLPMADLRQLCEETGFGNVKTYIASGNVVFTSDQRAKLVKSSLEASLEAYADKPIPVILRTALELRAVLDENPFPDADPSKTLAVFLEAKPTADALDKAVGKVDEEASIGEREIYIHYPRGLGQSKFRIPAAKNGTARNMNTIARMLELASSQDQAGN